MPSIQKPFFWLLLLVVLLSACSTQTATPTAVVTPSVTLSPTSTIPDEPTATLVPAAAIVNGERISLAWLEEELHRYLIAQEAMGEVDVDEAAARAIVLSDLIDQVLLAQGAREAGASISDVEVQSRLDALAMDVDLEVWMMEWGYTRETLFELLKLQVLVAYQRDLIVDAIPEELDQIEVQQIFAFTEAGADRALLRLNSGTAFEDVAFEFSPDTGGYLGWVPRGYLLIPAVEEAVFNQPVGTYTDVIESDIGYHIILVIDRNVQPLSLDARLTLQRQALHQWLIDRRTESTIEVLVD